MILFAVIDHLLKRWFSSLSLITLFVTQTVGHRPQSSSSSSCVPFLRNLHIAHPQSIVALCVGAGVCSLFHGGYYFKICPQGCAVASFLGGPECYYYKGEVCVFSTEIYQHQICASNIPSVFLHVSRTTPTWSSSSGAVASPRNWPCSAETKWMKFFCENSGGELQSSVSPTLVIMNTKVGNFRDGYSIHCSI